MIKARGRGVLATPDGRRLGKQREHGLVVAVEEDLHAIRIAQNKLLLRVSVSGFKVPASIDTETLA